MADTITVAVIGLGRAGYHHARTFQRIPGARLVAVCDTNRELVDRFAAQSNAKGYTDYRSILDDPAIDAVSIVLPDNAHVDASKAAVAAGKNILIEKPLASNLEDARTIYEAAKDYGPTFMVGHLLRYEPRYAGAKETISSGKIGELIHLYFRRNSPIPGALRYKNYTDLDMHVMIHDIDAANWFVGKRVKSIYARERTVRLREQGVKDTIFALGTYEDGTLVCWEASWALPESCPHEIDDKAEVLGTDGVIYIDSCDKGLNIITNSGIRFPDSRHWPEVNGEVGGAMLDEITHFLRCVRDGVRPVSGVTEAYEAVVVVDAVRRSLASGQAVEL